MHDVRLPQRPLLAAMLALGLAQSAAAGPAPANNGGAAALRLGDSSATVSWRADAKPLDCAHNQLASGGRVDDNWRQQQAGFRADRERDLDSASITGNLYRGHAEQAAPGVVNIAGSKQELGAVRTGGANLTGRWLHTLADGGSLSLQAYADFSRRQVPPTFTESLDIMDLQFQHSLPQRGRHGVVWGVAPVGRVHGAA